MLLSKCAICGSKKSRFTKTQEASGISSSLGLRAPLSKVSLLGDIFLLAGDKFMPEMHLKQSGFTYSACRPFIKHKQRIQKFKETGDTRYICRSKLDKACFQHNMAYGDFKNLAK